MHVTIIIVFFVIVVSIIIKIIAKEVKGGDKIKHGDIPGSVVTPIKEGGNRDYQRDIFMGFFVFFFVSLLVYVFNNLLAFYPTSPEYKLSFITFLPGILFASYFFDQAYENYHDKYQGRCKSKGRGSISSKRTWFLT